MILFAKRTGIDNTTFVLNVLFKRSFALVRLVTLGALERPFLRSYKNQVLNWFTITVLSTVDIVLPAPFL